MRLIDADALIEKLDEMQLDTAYLLDNEDVGIARARDIVDGFPTAPQWISVDERLPERHRTVLAVNKYGDLSVTRWNGEFWHTTFSKIGDRAVVDRWMEMPEL